MRYALGPMLEGRDLGNNLLMAEGEKWTTN
jgi:hypothetical protein